MLNTPSSDEHFQAGVREGVRQCLGFGVTTIGDISLAMPIDAGDFERRAVADH